MSLETHSTKRNRVYQRAFDHDEAKVLRAAGWSYAKLADHFGVSVGAVRRVCDPRVRQRMDQQAAAFIEKQRQPCLGGCGALVWMHQKNAGRSGLCPTCMAIQKAAAGVREDTLRCSKCREWKPDDEFGRQTRPTRRGRRNRCRVCETADRRALRRKNRAREHYNDLKRKGHPMAKYQVMRRDDDGRWEERGEVEAASRVHAIERVADEGGTWVAVGRGQMNPLEVQPAMAFKVVTEDARRIQAVAAS